MKKKMYKTRLITLIKIQSIKI